MGKIGRSRQVTFAEWYAVANEGDRRFRGEVQRRSVQVKGVMMGSEAQRTMNKLNVNYRNTNEQISAPTKE